MPRACEKETLGNNTLCSSAGPQLDFRMLGLQSASIFSICGLESIQGAVPEWMYVVPPGVGFQPEKYRVLDFAAYYRFIKARLERAVEQNRNGITTSAEATAHCEICRWFQECDAEWRKQDHLSLVAGMNRLQRKQTIGLGSNDR